MKKRDFVVLIVSMAIIVLLIGIYPRFTGRVVNTAEYLDDDTFGCSDSDDGKDYFVKGTVKQGDIEKGSDYCTSESRLKEYYCSGETSSTHRYYICDYKCEDGACIKENGVEEEGTKEDEVEEIEEKIIEKEIEGKKEIEGLPSLSFSQKIIKWIKYIF